MKKDDKYCWETTDRDKIEDFFERELYNEEISVESNAELSIFLEIKENSGIIEKWIFKNGDHEIDSSMIKNKDCLLFLHRNGVAVDWKEKSIEIL